jgi:hypothetical protein
VGVDAALAELGAAWSLGAEAAPRPLVLGHIA